MKISTIRVARPHWFKGRLMLALLLGTMLFAPAAFGSGMCTPASYATYQLGPCMLGQFTFSDFTFSSQALAGSPTLLTNSQIMVDPTGSAPTLLNIRIMAPAATPFSVGPGQSARYTFEYHIDPVLPIIDDETLDLGPNDPVTLTAQFCGNGIITSSPAFPVACSSLNGGQTFPGSLSLMGPSPVPQSAFFAFPVPSTVTTEDIRLILQLDGGTTGSSVSYFGSENTVTFGGPSATPEPSTSLLVLAGLAIVFPMARRRLRAAGPK